MENTNNTYIKQVVRISVDIPLEWHQFKTTNRLTWAEIMGLGIKAKKDNPQLISRINEQERKIEILVQKVAFFAQRLFDLEGKVPVFPEKQDVSTKKEL